MATSPIHFRKILVATDFSECAAAALEQAMRLARSVGADVTLAHAIPLTRDSMESFSNNPWYVAANAEEIELRLRHHTEQRLRQALAGYHGNGVRADLRTLWGTPFVELIQLVLEEGYDLVVVGTRGSSAVRRFLVGSTATRLVRKCPCPVWTVRSGSARELSSILVPVDFSEMSRSSLQVAADLAAPGEAALHVLHVCIEQSDYAFDLMPEPNEFQTRARRRSQRRQALTQLEAFVKESQLPVKSSLHVETGDAWRKIVAAARKYDADLIVMGTVGRSGVAGLLLGNTAEKVLHASPASLLTLKPAGFVSPIVPREAAVHA